MEKQPTAPKKLTLSSSKKEMLDAYNQLQKQLQERAEVDVKPEQKIEQKKERQAVEVADALSMEGIGKEIGNLRSEIGTMLVRLSDRLEEEVGKYTQVKHAVAAKERELQEIYEIERTVTTLAALLETQQQKREQFEADMAQKRESLQTEVEEKRRDWDREKSEHDAEIKERTAVEKKARERDSEEFRYTLERERQMAREGFEYEKKRLEREVAFRKEEMERDLLEREKAVVAREQELEQLRQRVEAFPKELDTAVAKAAQRETERLKGEAKAREELLKKEYEGETRVLQAQIEALQRTVAEQTERIARMAGQLEKSYAQVQDIAVKAIESSSGSRTVGAIQLPAVAHGPRVPQSEG